MARYNIGLWAPTRASMSPISIDTPGMWVESLKADFLAALGRNPDFNVIDGLDFRKAHIRKGDVFLGDFNFADLDLFFWFGELDRKHNSFHVDILEAIGQHTIVINDAGALRIALDKVLTQLHLSRKGITVPYFLFVSRSNVAEVRELVNQRPFVLKPRLGSFGVGITKITSHDHLVDVVDYSEFDAHFLEEFIESPPDEFIGINIIGGNLVSGYGKERSKFRGWKVFDRDRRGGGMVPKAPSPEQIQIAFDVARATGLDMLGVDIIRSSTGQDFVIDVNSFPGLYPAMSEQSGVDVAELLVAMIRRKLEKGG